MDTSLSPVVRRALPLRIRLDRVGLDDREIPRKIQYAV